MKEDLELIQSKLKATQEELANTKVVLGTLIVFLQRELGSANAEDLLEQLNK